MEEERSQGAWELGGHENSGKLLSGIHKYQIPVVGFVNESLLYIPGETDARIALLEAWSDAGVESGNHLAPPMPPEYIQKVYADSQKGVLAHQAH